MQQLTSSTPPDQQASRVGAPRSQVILIIALLLFSIAGLASGFSTGALTGKSSTNNKLSAQSTPVTNTMPTIKGQRATPKPKTSTSIIPLGCPKVIGNTSINSGIFEVPDGATMYTFTAQAVDTTGNEPNKIFCTQANQPIRAGGITFKLWIIKHVGNRTLTFPNLGQLTQPIDGRAGGKNFPELQNALQFETPQVQQSNTQGQVTWHYKINPGLKQGTYTLVVLTNWQGKTANWTWRDLVVKI